MRSGMTMTGGLKYVKLTKQILSRVVAFRSTASHCSGAVLHFDEREREKEKKLFLNHILSQRETCLFYFVHFNGKKEGRKYRGVLVACRRSHSFDMTPIAVYLARHVA
jgi:hypothetical protein